jgi:hypothetical protein
VVVKPGCHETLGILFFGTNNIRIASIKNATIAQAAMSVPPKATAIPASPELKYPQFIRIIVGKKKTIEHKTAAQSKA